MAYSGSIDLISGIRPKNGGSFPLVSAADVYVDDNTRLDAALARVVAVTWAELVALRSSGQLVPGRAYRIVDYVATTNGNMYSRSANHPFDIVVTADDRWTLNEAARAVMHETVSDFSDGVQYAAGDYCRYEGVVYACVSAHHGAWDAADFSAESPYFLTCNLSAWTVRYSLDNDTGRFAWADTEGGRGVVYRLVDEWGNDVPYDFKGMQFKVSGDDVWRYTFDSGSADGNADMSLDGSGNDVHGNRISACYSIGAAVLNRIVFMGAGCSGNVFGEGCSGNVFGEGCSGNVFGEGCRDNTLGIMCERNTFGSGCCRNTFGTSVADLKSYIRFVTIETGNGYINLVPTGTTSANSYYQNVTVKAGVNTTATYKTISDPNVGQTFHTTFKPSGSREVEI